MQLMLGFCLTDLQPNQKKFYEYTIFSLIVAWKKPYLTILLYIYTKWPYNKLAWLIIINYYNIVKSLKWAIRWVDFFINDVSVYICPHIYIVSVFFFGLKWILNFVMQHQKSEEWRERQFSSGSSFSNCGVIIPIPKF